MSRKLWGWIAAAVIAGSLVIACGGAQKKQTTPDTMKSAGGDGYGDDDSYAPEPTYDDDGPDLTGPNS